MFKKILIGISAAMVLATGVSAMDFCKTMDNLFIKGNLEKIYLKHNNEKLGEYCEVNIGSPACQGEMEAYQMLANAMFNKIGFNSIIGLLNKYGATRQYSPVQVFINYNNFFKDYLREKLKKMNKNERKIFLEKLFLFFNRVSDNTINLQKGKVKKYLMDMYFSQIFKKELNTDINNTKVAKELLNLAEFVFSAKLRGVNKDIIEGSAYLAYIPQLNLPYRIFNHMEGFDSKDPQLGGNADNLKKFFVLAATKNYRAAFDLINKTYSNEFIKEFNKYLKEVCKIK